MQLVDLQVAAVAQVVEVTEVVVVVEAAAVVAAETNAKNKTASLKNETVFYRP